MSGRVAGKVAVVTGAGQGQGAAEARLGVVSLSEADAGRRVRLPVSDCEFPDYREGKRWVAISQRVAGTNPAGRA